VTKFHTFKKKHLLFHLLAAILMRFLPARRFLSASSSTPSYASLDITKLDGGAGTDSLSFGNIGSQGSTELTLTHGGATNFENIDGTGGVDIIRGDTNVNVLRGSGGADTIYGGGGNDTLSGSTAWRSRSDSASDRQQAANDSGNDTDDNLYGQAGDDLLIGTIGDNILDGGTGADTIYSGSGSDTIILRAGDGGSTVAAADTIADFTDGSDVLGMDDGLAYTDLTIAQSGSDTVISIKSSSEYLAVLTGVNASALSEADFTPVDIV
jgi:Ca2+-binding RTX toxin-like protein